MKGDNKHHHRQRKGQAPQGRNKTSIRIHLENCIYGILIVQTTGSEQEFVPIRRLEIQRRFRDAHAINLTERQVSYLLDTLAKKGIIEREFHSRDRNAKSWKDQVTRYKVVNRSWPFP
ncbi:hypothetical protein ES703_76400 [subsurface metagenome]